MKITINTAYDPQAECPEAGAYGWAPGVPDLPDDPRIGKTPLEVRLRVAARRALDAKGYVLEGGDPVFLVGFQVVLEPNVDYSEILGKPDSTGRWILDAEDLHVLDRGSVAVRLLDPETMRPIWCSVCQADVDMSVPEEEKRERLTHIVALMLEGFPPVRGELEV
jgi:hypothetical protein